MTSKLKPNSTLLSTAVVGGAGMALPPGAGTPPTGMGTVLLYVPLATIAGLSPLAIQEDLGLPWSGPEGQPVWFQQG